MIFKVYLCENKTVIKMDHVDDDIKKAIAGRFDFKLSHLLRSAKCVYFTILAEF